MISGIGLQLAIALAVVSMAAGVVLLPILKREAQMSARMRAVRDGVTRSQTAAPTADLKHWMRPFAAVGRAVIGSGLLSQKAIGDLEQTMSAAGYRSGSAVALFLGAKIALVTGFPALAWFVVKLTGFMLIKPIIVFAFAAVIGLLLPDFIVRGIRKRYLAAVDDGLPAALDLLIICAEAGLALEAGFERVAAEFEEGSRPTANELRNTATEMKILSDRRQALVNMGTRTGLESMIRLGGMLAQSQKYGTSLTQALRTLSAEMRAIALTRFEARAARLPVLLTIPMILFILPCIFVVVAGPAAVQIMQIMRAH